MRVFTYIHLRGVCLTGLNGRLMKYLLGEHLEIKWGVVLYPRTLFFLLALL